jgi:hypothetical protein
MENLSSSPQNLAKKLTWFWIVLLVLPFVITAFIQFSCFPMITSGKLRQVCYTKPYITDVLTDFRTQGITLYNMAKGAVLNNDQDLLNELKSNLERPRVDYDSQKLKNLLSIKPPRKPTPLPIPTPTPIKPPTSCESKFVRNLSIGILTGLTIGGLVLTVGSGGLLAPIAAGAAFAGGTATTWLVEQFSKCP